MKLKITFDIKKVIIVLIALFCLILLNKIVNHYFLTYEFSDKYEKAEWFYKIQRNKGITVIEISGNSEKITSDLYLDFQTITPVGIVIVNDKYRVIKRLPKADDFDVSDVDKNISYSNFADKTTLLQHIAILKTLKNQKSKAIKFYYN